MLKKYLLKYLIFFETMEVFIKSLNKKISKFQLRIIFFIIIYI